MASDTPAGQPATLPAAVQAATGALHYGDPAENDGTGCACTDADQHDEFWHRDQADAIRALEAAAPHLAKATLNDFRRTSRDDYQDTYRDWWARIVENPDGTLNRDQVARELADYAALMTGASEVYMAVTNGRVSKPNTLPQAVIGLAEECARELAAQAVRDSAIRPHGYCHDGSDQADSCTFTEENGLTCHLPASSHFPGAGKRCTSVLIHQVMDSAYSVSMQCEMTENHREQLHRGLPGRGQKEIYWDGEGPKAHPAEEKMPNLPAAFGLTFPVHVRYAYYSAGYEAEQSKAAKSLERGKIYTVSAIDVGQSWTYLTLAEIPGKRFSSVFFAPAWPDEEDGE